MEQAYHKRHVDQRVPVLEHALRRLSQTQHNRASALINKRREKRTLAVNEINEQFSVSFVSRQAYNKIATET